MVSPARRRAAVHYLVRRHKVSERRACKVICQHRSTQRYAGVPSDFEMALTKAMNTVAEATPGGATAWSGQRFAVMGGTSTASASNACGAWKAIASRRRAPRTPARRPPDTTATRSGTFLPPVQTTSGHTISWVIVLVTAARYASSTSSTNTPAWVWLPTSLARSVPPRSSSSSIIYSEHMANLSSSAATMEENSSQPRLARG